MSRYISLLVLLLLTSCSITEHLPQGEVLYTGVDRIVHHRVDTVDDAVSEAVALALEVQPNSALLGSAYRMSPFPIGLWIYNGLYTEKEHGFRHWLWSHFKSEPTLISQVNPSLRARAAEAALKDEGYFDASVGYNVVPARYDSLKARVAYSVTYRHQSRLGTIRYVASRRPRIDSIIVHTLADSYLHTGDRFSATNLEAERNRIAQVIQDSGYYFFRPEHVRLTADSTRLPNTVDLRLLIGVGADTRALSPCVIDSAHYHLDFGAGLKTRYADTLQFLTVGYNGSQQVRTKYLRQALGFNPHDLCTPGLISLTKALNARLNTFKYTTTSLQLLCLASDSLANDTTSLRLNIDATYNVPWHGTTEVGCVYKDNQQMGPGIQTTATRRNLFGGGEKLSLQLTGSYEWRTGNQGKGSMLNSYELGAKVSLDVPRLQLPRWLRPDSKLPVSSGYSLSIDWTRRGGLFELVKAAGQISYGFSLNHYNTFNVTPLKLSYLTTIRRTVAFNLIVDDNPGLAHSFEDQFIPMFQLGWTYDNSASYAQRGSKQYANVTLTEAGGLIDVLMGEFGTHRKQGERQLFFQPFSQFLKATAELRHTQQLGSKLTLACRLLGGIGYAYGNSQMMPYPEQFYIGGPNSLRGFRVRGVGPGSWTYYSIVPSRYDYLSRIGDIKLEGNVELRFPLVGSLHGAWFADAGNVWNLPQYNMPSTMGMQGWDTFRQLAVDTGVGFRLDLGMLVMRLDLGLPLHDPGKYTEDDRYFNRNHRMLHQIEYNLAVGYPF